LQDYFYNEKKVFRVFNSHQAELYLTITNVTGLSRLIIQNKYAIGLMIWYLQLF